MVVLDQRVVEIGEARPGQDITPGIAAQVDARWIAETRVAVLRIGRLRWRRGKREAFRLYVVVGISRVHQRTTAGSIDPVGIVPRVTAIEAERVAVGTERSRKGNACVGL